MQKKQLKLSAVLLLGFLGLTGLQAQVEMNLKEKSGSKTAYTLNDIKKITFSSGNITVAKNEGGSDLTNVIYLNFSKVISGVQKALPIQTKSVLFPNPVTDVLNLRLPSVAASTGVIEILSLEGKIVYTQALNSKMVVYQINLSNLSKGLYICKINNGTSIESMKFIKQ